MNHKRSRFLHFWTTLPGVLTGIAAVLGATATILGLVLANGGGHNGPEVTIATWARSANEICSTARSDLAAVDVRSDPASLLHALPRLDPIIERANQQLAALPRPRNGEAKIQQLLFLASEQGISEEHIYEAIREGNRAKALRYVHEAQPDGDKLTRLDSELGANICAEGYAFLHL